MSIGSGMSSSFGWSKETVAYGTRVAPAKFIRHRSCSLLPMYNRVQGEGITAAGLGLRGDHLVQTHSASTASVEFDVATLNMVQLMENLMGTTTGSVQQAATAAYLHTFTLADNYATTSKSLTLQTNVALRTGTDKAKEITGAKATSATFSTGVGELLTASMEFDGQGYSTAQSLAAPSYVSGLPFHFGQAALKLGTYASESAVSGVRAFSATINRNMDTEAFTFGAPTAKLQPVSNAPVEISGSIEADYLATADFEDRFTGLTLPSLVFECVSTTVIASTYYPTFRITVPGVHISGPGVTNEGRDVPRQSWDWNWVYDGTNLPTIQIMSTETSV